MKKKLLITLLILLLSTMAFASGNKEESAKIIASTSWVASYIELAGGENVKTIAPANLTHPPEYELKADDIVSLNNAEYFFYGGYEVMMQTISSSLSSEERQDNKISTGNSIENISKQVEFISSILGTEPNLDEYIALVENAKTELKEKGISDLKIACHSMQTQLAKDLGLNIVTTFGPGEVSAAQIQEASEKQYDIIIDNYHNPVASPLKDVTKGKLILWRNFPDNTEKNALINTISENISFLTEI